MNNLSDNICLSQKLSNQRDIVYGFCNKFTNFDADSIENLDGISRLVKLNQLHSAAVHFVDTNTDHYTELEGDALITKSKGICIGVYTADCIPILLYDKDHSLIAAVHAGWRGTLKGIAVKTIGAMISKHNSNPKNIISVIGPGVGGCCFEVEADVATKFIEKYDETDSFINPKGSKYILDLQKMNKRMLQNEGVDNIEVIDICTICDLNYHSYRREGKGVGSQLSFIGLRNNSGGT